MAAAPGDEPRFTLGAELDRLDDKVAGLKGAFRANQERAIRAAGRARIIATGLTGMAAAGRGDEARALLDHDDFAGELDESGRARLIKNIQILSQAHDRDRKEREKREGSDKASARSTAAIAFATGFRPRLVTGEATHGEIAAAETGGVLTTNQAERLRTEMAEEQIRREQVSAKAGRVTSVLQTGSRLDPEDLDDHDDLAHHYEATLKPALADLDPAQKASAISGYVAQTGIAPEAAVTTLLGLTATGDAEGRIAATRELVAVFDTDPTARNKVPPGLAAYAETLVDLADTYELAPDEAIKTADAFFGDSGPGADRPNPALFQLVSAKNTGVQTDAQPDAKPNSATRKLVEFLERDSAVRETLPPELAEGAGLLADLNHIDTRSPDATVGQVDTLLVPGGEDQELSVRPGTL